MHSMRTCVCVFFALLTVMVVKRERRESEESEESEEYIHTYIHAYMHTYIHTYMHTYIRTYIHTHIHTHKPLVSGVLCAHVCHVIYASIWHLVEMCMSEQKIHIKYLIKQKSTSNI